jgi:hypothetical protein
MSRESRTEALFFVMVHGFCRSRSMSASPMLSPLARLAEEEKAMTAFHVMSGASDVYSRPVINRIGIADVFDALRLGIADFREKPSHYVFLCLMYPIAGIFLAVATSSANLLPIIFPLMSGFALMGPLAALGLYEISRRRETGMDTSWRHALRRDPVAGVSIDHYRRTDAVRVLRRVACRRADALYERLRRRVSEERSPASPQRFSARPKACS